MCLHRDRYLSLPSPNSVLGERILFHGSLHTIAPPFARARTAVIKMRFLASKTDRDRRNVGDDFSPRIIQRHKRSLWSEKSGRSIVHPRFNSCPPCSVTFRQLHCQVRARVRHPLAVGNLINNRNCRTVYVCMLCAMYRTCGERPFCFLSEIKLELLKRQLGKATLNICHCTVFIAGRERNAVREMGGPICL